MGKALALRLAREGADVVIAANREASTEKLPGSKYDTANEVRALGRRRALAVPTDVRSEEAIAGMVEKTIAEFGALPHMVKQKWGHVLNMCPKLYLGASPGKVAYIISKLEMARVAIGLAAEHKADNIAANTL